MSTDLLKEAAYTAGRHAAATGMPLAACPYTPDDGQPDQVLALWWLRGYRSSADSAGGGDSGDQVASLSGAAREEFNRLHPRGFGGKFGHHQGHAEAGLEGAAAHALVGADALNSVPSKLTPGARAHNGHYEGEQLDAPKGAGKVRALSQYEGVDYQQVNDFLRGRYGGQPGPAQLPPRDDTNQYGPYQLLTTVRGGDPGNLSVVDIAKEIDKTMEVSKLPQDVVVERTVRRGETLFGRDVWYGDIIDWDEPDFDKQDKQIDEHWNQGERPDLTGMQFRDFGYSSTTVSPEITKAYADRYVRVASPLEGEPIVFRILVPAGTGAVALSPLEKGQEAEILLERGLTFEVVKDHGVDDEGVRRLDVRVIPDGSK
jgi:hypothetical protein